MFSKRVACGDAGMFERGGGFMHSNALHDRSRPDVEDCCKGHDFGQVENFESDTKSTPGSLAGVTAAPVLIAEPPADFDAWGKRQIDDGYAQAYESNEPAAFLRFGGPETPAVLGDQGLTAISHRIACGPIKQRGKKFHDSRIRVERRKGIAVGGEPLTQAETFCFEFDQFRHG